MRLFQPGRDPGRPEDVRAFVEQLVEMWSDTGLGQRNARRLLKTEARTAQGRLLLFFSEQRLAGMMAETHDPATWNLYRGLRQLLFKLARMLPE
ncbi:MAG: hypothetical protein ABIJ61_05660 [bacterium]